MNPRFTGHYPFSHIAGANIPAALVAWAKGQTADPAWLRVIPGVKGYKGITVETLRANELAAIKDFSEPFRTESAAA
jgi:carbamoyl-phosphate synthase large subunit